LDYGITNLCRTCPEHCWGCANLAGYISWGVYGFIFQDWSRYVGFTTNSAWYIMTSIESWNGLWGNEQGQTLGQYSFHHWFDSIAFRGTNYSNTPVGAVSDVGEPGGACFIDFKTYFRLWAQGKAFAVCVWNAPARSSVQATGDPLVRR
jgi:hypothetical protein